MKRLLAFALAAGLAVAAAGCGESTQVTVYKQGHYQGKPDTQPWDNDRFKSDQSAWERTVKARNGVQNEYKRISGS